MVGGAVERIAEGVLDLAGEALRSKGDLFGDDAGARDGGNFHFGKVS